MLLRLEHADRAGAPPRPATSSGSSCLRSISASAGRGAGPFVLHETTSPPGRQKRQERDRLRPRGLLKSRSRCFLTIRWLVIHESKFVGRFAVFGRRGGRGRGIHTTPAWKTRRRESPGLRRNRVSGILHNTVSRRIDAKSRRRQKNTNPLGSGSHRSRGRFLRRETPGPTTRVQAARGSTPPPTQGAEARSAWSSS
jgi:hypothetical protein